MVGGVGPGDHRMGTDHHDSFLGAEIGEDQSSTDKTGRNRREPCLIGVSRVVEDRRRLPEVIVEDNQRVGLRVCGRGCGES